MMKECALCFEPYSSSKKVLPAALECGHVFCLSCLAIMPSHDCPQCRKAYRPSQTRRVFIEDENSSPASSSRGVGYTGPSLQVQAEAEDWLKRLAKVDISDVPQTELLLTDVRSWIEASMPHPKLTEIIRKIHSSSDVLVKRMDGVKTQSLLTKEIAQMGVVTNELLDENMKLEAEHQTTKLRLAESEAQLQAKIQELGTQLRATQKWKARAEQRAEETETERQARLALRVDLMARDDQLVELKDQLEMARILESARVLPAPTSTKRTAEEAKLTPRPREPKARKNGEGSTPLGTNIINVDEKTRKSARIASKAP